MKKTLCLVFALAAAVLLEGCAAVLLTGAAVGAGAAGIAYTNGELKSNEPVSMEKAWAATEKAVEALEFKPVSKKKDALAAKYEVVGAADKRVVISLKNVGEKVTEVRIRIGTFGDESFSRTILSKIQASY